MRTASYSAIRARLAKALDEVNADHAPILITRQNGKPAVLISLEDYQALDETSYLLRSPANRRRLLQAKAEIDAQVARDRKARGRRHSRAAR